MTRADAYDRLRTIGAALNAARECSALARGAGCKVAHRKARTLIASLEGAHRHAALIYERHRATEPVRKLVPGPAGVGFMPSEHRRSESVEPEAQS